MSNRIIFTGTHFTPALAVIEEIKKKEPWEIYYLGRKYTLEGEKIPSPESQILPKMGVKFIPIPAGRLQRRFTRWTIPSLLRVPFGLFKALKVILEIKPKVIVSFGGYVGVPVVIAGFLRRVPILIHEQTATVGLANKISARFAQKIAISFPESKTFFPEGKVVFTGNPLRPEIFKSGKPLFPLNEKKKTIYITGGSQGASIINETVERCLLDLVIQYNVVHQCGAKDYPHFKEKKAKDYFPVDYVDNNSIGWVFEKADLVVSRGGANTILELAALGKPAIIIPIPWATHNEQLKNAEFLAKSGVAEILPQEKLNPQNLKDLIEKMMANLSSYQKAGEKLKKTIPRNGAQKIVAEIYKLL
ncbi:MAG: UDP-N-acetylglucosamine--N-acetylmuramyl-(pentapeptide) pyrophosphoryl-undecaprenol N-acetylglucosamine transferase [Patescibacteria group bacterium]|jgi:UDP-N-acetylglucosamine--N-acetylmuramyl-(pentapeptide) pyrophosphoryl-undecaprenol N-acetylglucosamine transferase